MASGDRVVEILREMPPGSSYAQVDMIVGAATPAESVLVWAFDTSTTEYLDFMAYLHGYDGGGLTFKIIWAAASGTSGEVAWEIAIRALPDDAEDINSTAHSYDFNAVGGGAGVTAPSAVGEVVYDTITFTDGADMDSWADGAAAIIRIRRNTGDADDDMAGDAYLLGIIGYET